MLSRRIATYLIGFAIGLTLCSVLVSLGRSTIVQATVLRDSLPLKMRYFREHAKEFDVVLIGDSRAYCGLHPEEIDPALGTRSLNLAIFAHWMPTQFPFVKDLIESLEPGTTVIWGLGQINFGDSEKDIGLRSNYPVRWSDVGRYLELGFPIPDLLANLATYNPLTTLYMEAPTVHRLAGRVFDRHWIELGSGVDDATGDSSPLRNEQEIEREFRDRPGVGRVVVMEEEGRITSVALHRYGGGYLRVELDREFFRDQQAALFERDGGDASDAEAASFEVPEPHPSLLSLFDASLDLLKEAGINVIVVELQEAPFRYRHPGIRRKISEFMWDEIRPRVEARGFTYVRPDYSGFTNEDYFDYNHLNSQGVEKLSRELVENLEPIMDTSKD